MARKTVKVIIPEGKPEELVMLAKSIAERFNQDPKNNPLKTLNMADFLTKQATAAEKRKEAKRLADVSQAMMGEVEQLMGTGPGQSRQSEGTLLYYLTMIRDLLLVVNRGNEEKLTEYGFKVLVGTAVTASRKDKATV